MDSSYPSPYSVFALKTKMTIIPLRPAKAVNDSQIANTRQRFGLEIIAVHITDKAVVID